MKILTVIFLALLASNTWAGNSWAGKNDELLGCYGLVQEEISAIEQHPHISKLGLGVDSGVAVGSVLAFLPTLGASLPIGLGVIAGRNVIRSVRNDVSIGGKERVLQLIDESNQYLEATSATTAEVPGDELYAALTLLWLRVDNAFAPQYDLEKVAQAVVEATQDANFCQDSSNYRMVHFKDYVLNRLGSKSVRS